MAKVGGARDFATREDEAIGTVSGAYMAGLRGAVMMPYQIPAVMVISERGTLGEFNALDAKRARQYADRRGNQH